MAIVIKKKVSLDYVGEDWKDCYLEFKVPTVKQVRSVANDKVNSEDVMKELFVGGKALDENGSVVVVKKEDIDDLPITLTNRAFEALLEIDPNSKRD